ncbi:MAG: CynX/NimT family MFS transporter [Acidimicrobiales bacterium]
MNDEASAQTGGHRQVEHLAVVVAVVILAFNLRPALASMAPVLAEVQRSTGLSSAVAGTLTTVPVLAFGACAPLAPVLGRRFGTEVTLLAALVVLGAGILVRSAPSLGGLFAGTVLVGAAIAVGNVLLPALIKRDFPGRARQVTGVYSVALSAGAALAAGVTVPVEHATGTGWRGVLALWALPVVAGVAVWAGRLEGAHHDVRTVRVGGRLWRDRLAWKVTVFMGLQSLGYYALLAWLPTIFEQHGVRPATAGWLLALSGFASLPSALLAPVLASTAARQRVAVAVAVGLNGVALAGLLWRPAGGAFVWMVVLGIAQGANIALALSFIVVRAPDPDLAAELSGMAQTVGYLVASVGPFLMGALRDATGGWTVPLVVLAAVLVPQVVSGVAASSAATVGGRPR